MMDSWHKLRQKAALSRQAMGGKPERPVNGNWHIASRGRDRKVTFCPRRKQPLYEAVGKHEKGLV